MNALGQHLSFQHFRLLYADTGILYFFSSFKTIFVDSLYWAQCCENLEQMIGKEPFDKKHYSEEEITNELQEWHQTKKKLFVTGTTPAEKREPLKWKTEYSTSSSEKGEMIALSP